MVGSYLHITLSDNDFSSSLEIMAKYLYNIFRTSKFPGREDIEDFKPLISKIWYATHEMHNYLSWKGSAVSHEITTTDHYVNYFSEHLKVEVVEFTDIPKWDNYESVYIPLFEYNFENSNTQPEIIMV